MVHKTNQKAVLKKRFLHSDKENCLKEYTILIHLENESSFAQLYLEKTWKPLVQSRTSQLLRAGLGLWEVSYSWALPRPDGPTGVPHIPMRLITGPRGPRGCTQLSHPDVRQLMRAAWTGVDEGKLESLPFVIWPVTTELPEYLTPSGWEMAGA